MGSKVQRWMLLLFLLSTAVHAATAQIATTQVADTIYRADGTPASGIVLIGWPAFTTGSGQAVASGSTSVVLGTSGSFSVQLAPNSGATPTGTYYTAVYHLDDGSTNREYWVVPASQIAVTLSAVRSSVIPTSVAMQTASKAYVDAAIAAAVAGVPLGGTVPYVQRSGDNMSGALVLSGDPTGSMQAADKHYVDAGVASVTEGIAQKLSLAPQATQVVSQPTGTELRTSRMNGTAYASQYVNGRGDNGISNAVASADCGSGCEIKAESAYGFKETYTPSTWNSGTHVEDVRGGGRRDSYMNPLAVVKSGDDAGQVIDVTSTRSATSEFQLNGAEIMASEGLLITHHGLTGGSNLLPQSVEGTVPYFKSSYAALSLNGVYNTPGQHILAPGTISCYGVGDCLVGSQFLTASGGFRDEADEGAHPFDIQVQEDSKVFQGTCSGGCTRGSTQVMVSPTSGVGTQGEGRYLIDKNPANVLTTGLLTGGNFAGNGGVGPTATFSGTAFPISSFFSTTRVISSQANNMAPGSVTVAIATTGVASGFKTATTGLASTGVACLADLVSGSSPTNYEMTAYTVLDSTHLQMTLNKVHGAGATIAVGGLCGYGLEQTVDTVAGIRQVFPVTGSFSASGLYYAGHLTAIVGENGQTSAFFSMTAQISNIRRSGNLVTISTATNLPRDINGLIVAVSGVADATFNGSFVVTTTGSNSFTYPETGANVTSSGGSIGMVTGGFALYPMAEVLGVFNASTQKVDGQMTLAPNTVSWAANDPLEEPHYFQQAVNGDIEFIGQTTPRPGTFARTGVEYEGNVGPGLFGWTVTNDAPASNYFGNGGTHLPPSMAYQAAGIWNKTLDAQAGEESVFSIHCTSRGCGRWSSGYNLFELDTNVGLDTVYFAPQTSSLSFNLRGAGYNFTPQGFSANTVNATTSNTTTVNATAVNATTVNATTLNGSVSAAEVSGGTLNPSVLPTFGASGSAHAAGAVPDPGSTAGASRYLREDGTWSAPTGSSSGSSSSAGAGLVTGATADYNFLQGGGSTLKDQSGNGNDGILGSAALAPSWTSTGLSFSGQAGVSLPATLNGTQTFFAAVSINPVTAGPQVSNQYPVLMSSSNGTTGFSLMYNSNAGNYTPYVYTPLMLVNGGARTVGPNLISGFHVIAAVLGTGSGSLDHIYIDGIELATYTSQGSSAGSMTSGNFYLGSSNVALWSISGFNGTYYRFRTYPTQLSSSDVTSVSNAIRNEVASRGVPVMPLSVGLGAPQLHAIGDSITAGQGVSTPWPSLLSLSNQAAYTITNWGVGGATAQALNASEPNRVALRCQTTQGPAIAVILEGSNDLINSTPTTVFSNLVSHVRELKQAGCLVFVGTILSRGGNDNSGNTMDADKNALDALILTGSQTNGADGVIDFAANPILGADGASTGATFQGDHIHPTQAGQSLLAAGASNVLNYAFGYKALNQHRVTTLPYSMTAADGYVSTGAVTTAGALTLPDCTGQSGAIYQINNAQSTYAVTVGPLNANQLINGKAFSSSIMVPANGSVTLRDIPNAKSVSGCHWEM